MMMLLLGPAVERAVERAAERAAVQQPRVVANVKKFLPNKPGSVPLLSTPHTHTHMLHTHSHTHTHTHQQLLRWNSLTADGGSLA